MGQKKVKFSKFPKFIVKNDPEKPPRLVWGFFTFQCFAFFLIFAFSCFSSSSFPLLLDFLKPKSGPSNEVIGYLFILICLYLFLWVGKIPQNPRQISRKISVQKSKTNSPTSFCRHAGRTIIFIWPLCLSLSGFPRVCSCLAWRWRPAASCTCLSRALLGNRSFGWQHVSISMSHVET